MKRKFLISVIFLLIILFICFPVRGNESTDSADVTKTDTDQKVDLYDTDTYLKRRAIQNVLDKTNSPLREEVDTFMEVCLEYSFDCYLLPAIAGVESSYGHAVVPGSHNPFGWGAGQIHYYSWEESIHAVASGIYTSYMSYGLMSIEEIGQKYATSTSWATHVYQKRSEFTAEEEQLELYFQEISVQ